MNDYIKRKDALEIVNNNLSRFMIALRIGDCPSADVVPVRHGRWIEGKLPTYRWGDKSTWECSVCHDVDFWRCNYCPNCGAKMDGELIRDERIF